MRNVNSFFKPCQGFSKVVVKHPSESFTRMSREAAKLASHIGNVLQIHEGKHHGVENRQHFGDGVQTHATAIFAQRRTDSAIPGGSVDRAPFADSDRGHLNQRAVLRWEEEGLPKLLSLS